MTATGKKHWSEYDFFIRPEEIPSGWTVTTLDEVAAKITDGTHKTPNYTRSGIRFISIKNIRPFQPINWNSYEKYISREEHEEITKRCNPEFDDLLFPRIGTLGYAKRIDFHEEVSIFVGLGLIKPEHSILLTKYLEFYMNTKYISDLSRKKANGSGRLTLPLHETKRFPIPLAPLNEQRRIVEKIEAMFDEIDKGIESLKTARTTLGLYRQSLLKSAFEGRLTADWRAQNPDKLESPETLLARIQKERETRYKAALDAWQESLANWCADGEKGKKPAKPKRPKTFPDDLKDLQITLPELPFGWRWAHLGWCSSGPEYGTAAKSSDTGEVPVIRMGNLQRGGIDWEDLAYTSDPNEIEQYSLKIGDVLFNRTNSPELVGKTSIYKGERPALFAGYLVRINQIDEIASGTYLTYFLNSQYASEHGKTVKTDGVNQSNINASKLQEYPFPYCSPAEQAEIVRILDAHLEAADALEAEIDAALTRADALRQSILKKAFSGRLVPQDPEDEPASALLERIETERAKAPKTKKRKTAHA